MKKNLVFYSGKIYQINSKNMKVKIGDKIHSSSYEPIMLIFESDMDRLTVIQHLSSMVEKEGVRKYVQAPDIINEEEIRNFMVVSDKRIIPQVPKEDRQ